MKLKRKIAMAYLLVAMSVAVPAPNLMSQDMRPPMTFIVVTDVSGSMNDRFPAPIQARLSDSTKLLDVRRRLLLLADHLPDSTRVIVTKFDHESFKVCDITLTSAEKRNELHDALASITSREGSTFLWRTADEQLALAKTIADSNPEGRVRVLLYTDGNDMEGNPKFSHKTIIEKYGKTLQSVVALDWVTIGYDLKADVKAALKEQGVNFTRADQPSDIVPLRAGFQLSKTKAKVGQEIGLQDQSIGVEIVQRAVDWGDKTPYENGEVLTHTYKEPGTYMVRYAVKSEDGKKDVASLRITVTVPEALKAKLNVSKLTVQVGESLTVNDETKGDVASRRFIYGANKSSDSKSFDVRFETPGQKRIRLIITDKYGQETETVAYVSVELPPPPIARIEPSSLSVLVGEAVVLSDASTGGVSRRTWKHSDQTSDDKSLRLSFDRADTYTVFLEVADQFGQTSSTEVKVTAKLPDGPVANFRFSREDVSPGDNIALINQSSNAVKFRWTIDDDKVLTAEHPTLKVHRYGDIKIEIEVWDRFGQSHRVSKSLSVALPAKPTVAFTLPQSAKPGQEFLIEDESLGVIDGDGEWYYDSELVCNDRVVRITPKSPGVHYIRRVVAGPGGIAELERKLNILSYELPIAGFTVGNQTPFLGDTIRITNTVGPANLIDRVVYEIDGKEAAFLDADDLARQPWFDFDCKSIGEKTIIQKVFGPGGETSASDSFYVSSRAFPPHIDFSVSQTGGRGSVQVVFENRCENVDHLEFDPGNGEPIQTYAGTASPSFTYEPGTAFPVATGYAAEEESFEAVTWNGPPINISEPIAAWVWNLIWQIPFGLLGFGGAFFMALRIRDNVALRAQSRIGGELFVRPADNPRQARSFRFDGLGNEESVEVNSDTVLKLSSSLEDQIVRYELKLQKAGKEPRTIELEPDQEVRLGDYTVCYTA